MEPNKSMSKQWRNDALKADNMECPLELDAIVQSMGQMTKGNMAMVEKYQNLENTTAVTEDGTEKIEKA